MVFAVSAVLKRRTARSNTSQNFRPIRTLAVGALCCVYVDTGTHAAERARDGEASRSL